MKHVVRLSHSHWQAGRWARAALALFVALCALVVGAARADIASANQCVPRSNGNLEGVACLFAPSGSEFLGVGGYIESSALSNTNSGFVDNDMWIVQPNTSPTPPYWVEAGIITGLTTCCGGQNFEFFWADQRPGSQFYQHMEGPAQSYTQYFDEIWQEDSTDWGVTIGGHQTTSTNNTMQPSLIRTGTEETAPGNTACSEQSSLDYEDASHNWHTGWGSAAKLGFDSPPVAAWQSVDNWVYDWSGSSESQSSCASSLGFTPSGAAAIGLTSSPSSSTDISPASPVSSSSGAGTPLTEAQISQSAHEFAASMGDPNPSSIEHVESTRQQAVFGLSGDKVSTNPNVYAIVMRGQFVANDASRPTDASAPSGSVLVLVIDASTGALTDFGIQDQVPDLTTLGPVTMDQ